MENIKAGDKIIDIHMSELKGEVVTPVVTAIEGNRLICSSEKYPRGYPHSFYEFEKGVMWDVIESVETFRE